ncbi:MAG: hypothetical protein QXT26_04940, partial [Thermoproteota archaeon]
MWCNPEKNIVGLRYLRYNTVNDTITIPETDEYENVTAPVELLVSLFNYNTKTNLTVEEVVSYSYPGNVLFMPDLLVEGESVRLGRVTSAQQLVKISVTLKVKFTAHGHANEYSKEVNMTFSWNFNITQSGPYLILQDGGFEVSSYTKNGWNNTPFYFEPVSIIAFVYGEIENIGSIDAINVSFYMVFGNSTHNWTIARSAPTLNIPAKGMIREISLQQFSIEEHNISLGKYNISFYANYSYTIGNETFETTQQLWVNQVKWGLQYCELKRTIINACVELIAPEIELTNSHPSNPAILTFSVSYKGYTKVNISVAAKYLRGTLFCREHEVKGSLEDWMEDLIDLIKDFISGGTSIGDILQRFLDLEIIPWYVEKVSNPTELNKLRGGNNWVWETSFVEITSSVYPSSVLTYGSTCTVNITLSDKKWYLRGNVLQEDAMENLRKPNRFLWPIGGETSKFLWKWYENASVNINATFYATYSWRNDTMSEVRSSNHIVNGTISNTNLTFIDDYRMVKCDMRMKMDLLACNAVFRERYGLALCGIGATVLLIGYCVFYTGVALLSNPLTAPGGVALVAVGKKLMIIGGIILAQGCSELVRAYLMMEEVRNYATKIIGDPPSDEDYTSPTVLSVIDFPELDGECDFAISCAAAAAEAARKASAAIYAGDQEMAKMRMRECSELISMAPPLEAEVPVGENLSVNASQLNEALAKYNEPMSELWRRITGEEWTPMRFEEGTVINITLPQRPVRVALNAPTIEPIEEDDELAELNGSAWYEYQCGNIEGAYYLAEELLNKSIERGNMGYFTWAAKLISLIRRHYSVVVSCDKVLYAGGNHTIPVSIEHMSDCSAEIRVLVDGMEISRRNCSLTGRGNDSVNISAFIPLHAKNVTIVAHVRSWVFEYDVFIPLKLVTFEDAVS